VFLKIWLDFCFELNYAGILILIYEIFMGGGQSKGDGGNGSSSKNISSNVVERSKPTGIAPRSIGFGNDITAFKDPSDKYSYPSNSTSRGGEGISNIGNIGSNNSNSWSNSGQGKLNPQVAKQITDKINVSEKCNPKRDRSS
jgi:hypothetical protein